MINRNCNGIMGDINYKWDSDSIINISVCKDNRIIIYFHKDAWVGVRCAYLV